MATSDSSDQVVARNGKVTLTISRSTGRFDVSWDGAASIFEAYGEAKLADGVVRKSYEFAHHDVKSKKLSDSWGVGTLITVRHWQKHGPEFRHTFWLYEGKPEVLVRMDLIDPSKKGSNMVAPVVTAKQVSLQHDGPLQSLFVPYDNDNYFRYSSDAWSEEERIVWRRIYRPAACLLHAGTLRHRRPRRTSKVRTGSCH